MEGKNKGRIVGADGGCGCNSGRLWKVRIKGK
jgi:hypothetical protein